MEDRRELLARAQDRIPTCPNPWMPVCPSRRSLMRESNFRALVHVAVALVVLILISEQARCDDISAISAFSTPYFCILMIEFLPATSSLPKYRSRRLPLARIWKCISSCRTDAQCCVVRAAIAVHHKHDVRSLIRIDFHPTGKYISS